MIIRRSVKRLAAVAACLMLVIAAVHMAAAPAYAADGAYTYKVRIYSGKEGTFDDGGKVKEYTCSYGEKLSLNIKELGIDLKDPDTYYVRGLKVAGHDNDEFSRLVLNSYVYEVTGDESFSVAYGLKGGMVRYTVNYVDEDGNPLMPSEDFYGMAGDKPVVSFRYIEGYAPNAYNMGKTLTENEAENVFTFVYKAGAADQNGGDGTDGQGDGTQNGGAANAQNGGGAANAAAGANAGADGNAGPEPYTDIDSNMVPKAVEPDKSAAGPESELSKQHRMSRILTGAAIAAAAVLLAVIFVAARRKRKEEAA